MTISLDGELIKRIEAIADLRWQRPHDLIDSIVKQFVMTYEDKAYFMRGEEETSFAQNILKALFPKPETNEYVTYMINLETYNRIEKIKEDSTFYARSPIVKRMIIKYLKENHLL